MITAESKVGALESLWARASLWRFSLMSAALLTLLFVLFPPEGRQNKETHAPPLPGNTATYTPQPAIGETSPPLSGFISSNPVPAARQNPSSIPTPAAPPSRTIATEPRTADLSLTTPSKTAAGRDASGADVSLMGRNYTGSIQVNGFNLPLPSGNWTMLANSKIAIPNSSGTGYFLGRIEHNRLVGAIIVYALRSNLKPGEGVKEFSWCNESVAIFIANEGATPFDHQACWAMHNIFTPPWQQWADRTVKLDNLSRSAAGDMAAKGVSYPQDFVAVHFFRAEKWGLLDASYLFSPESNGIATHTASNFRDSDWFGLNIQRYPEKAAYATKLKNWGSSFWPRFKTAFAEGE